MGWCSYGKGIKGLNESKEIDKGLSHFLYPVIFCSPAYFRLVISWLWDSEYQGILCYSSQSVLSAKHINLLDMLFIERLLYGKHYARHWECDAWTKIIMVPVLVKFIV